MALSAFGFLASIWDVWRLMDAATVSGCFSKTAAIAALVYAATRNAAIAISGEDI